MLDDGVSLTLQRENGMFIGPNANALLRRPTLMPAVSWASDLRPVAPNGRTRGALRAEQVEALRERVRGDVYSSAAMIDLLAERMYQSAEL